MRDLRGLGNVGLVRLTIWLNDFKRVRIANPCESFQQTSRHSRRVLLFIHKRIKQIRTFQLRQVTDRLLLPSRIQIANEAIQRFRTARAIQRPIEREPYFE